MDTLMKTAVYSVELAGRPMIHGGAPRSFIGPFVSLFENERRVDGRIADQSREYLKNGRILATGLDLLLEHLLMSGSWGSRPQPLTVHVGDRAMTYLEDLDREFHDYVNVVLNTYRGSRGSGVTVFDIEGHPSIGMAMEAANSRQGGSADVWTLDLTTIEVAMKQVTAAEPGASELEQKAAKLLKEFNAEFWHSGGGIMLCQLEFPRVKMEMLVSESEESPGRYMLGTYDVANGERNEEAQMFDPLTDEQLVAKVRELAANYNTWPARGTN